MRYRSLNSHRKSKSLGFIKKHFSPIWIFVGVLATFLGEFQKIFLCSHLIGQKNCIFHPSRRRIYNLFTKFNSPPTYKDKNSAKYPLVKNIPHLYPWNRGFEYPFSKMFIVYLHSRAVWKRLRLIAIGEQKNQSFLAPKNCPSPICKKWGFGRVFWRMIYSLFTETALANKKCALRRKVKVVWDVLIQT